MRFTSAVILAAGSGTRFGGSIKKQFVDVLGYTPVQRCAIAFEKTKVIDEIIFVGDVEEITSQLKDLNLKKLKKVVPGGATRQESALCGFDAVNKRSDYVAIHDAARCLITPDIIEETVKAAYKYRASVAAEKTVDTVKRADKDGFLAETLDRDYIWLAKTPQVFLNDLYRVAAYTAKKENFVATDDCMLAERLGFKVKLVDCGHDNIKLTSYDDLDKAISILKKKEGESK